MKKQKHRGASEIPGLIADLGDDSTKIREYARHVLVAMGQTAVEPLMGALVESNEYGRGQAAKALGEIGDPATLPALIHALEDEKFDVRWLAAKAIVPFGREGLMVLLRALIEHSESSLLRQSAHHVLHDEAHEKWSAQLAPVKNALECSDPENALPGAAANVLKLLAASK